MKKVSVLVCLLLFAKLLIAQFADVYRFETDNKPFVPLTNAVKQEWLHDTLWHDTFYTRYGWPANVNRNQFCFPFADECMVNIRFDPASTPRGRGSSVWIDGDSFQITFRICHARLREINNTPPYGSVVSLKVDSSLLHERWLIWEFLNIGIADSLYRVVGHLNMQLAFSSKGTIEYRYGDCLVPRESIFPFIIDNKFFRIGFGFITYKSMPHLGVGQGIYTYGDPQNPSFYRSYSNVPNNPLRDSTLWGFPSNITYRFYREDMVGVAKNSEVANWKLYPNPAKGSITLPIETTSCQAIDVNGKRIVLNQISHKEYDISELQPGIYVLIIENEHGLKLTQKLIVHQ